VNEKSAPIEKFLIVASALDGDTILTPKLMSELIAMAARLDEIERERNGKL
jgi:hypothetical protein